MVHSAARWAVVFVGFGFVFLAPGSATAQDPPTETKRPEVSVGKRVEELVRELGRGSLEDRNSAEAKLIELGPKALPYVPPPDSNMPAELKVRLQRVIEELERRAAESIWNPSRFELEGKRTMAEWFAEIERQTGNHIIADELPGGHVSLSMKPTEFWKGLDQLLDQWKLDVDIYRSDVGGVSILPRAANRRSRAKLGVYAGPVRVEPIRAVLARDARQVEPPTARLELELAWEPRISPIAVRFPLLEFFAVDDKGTLHECSSPEANPTFPVRPGMMAVTLAVPFEAPPRTVRRWSRVGGVCQLLVPGEMADFDFPDLTKTKTLRQAGVQVSFEGARQNGDVWELRLRLEYDKAFTGLDSHRGWVQENPIYIIGPDGKREEPLGMQLTFQTRTSMGFAFLFDLTSGIDRYKLHYATPAKILRREVSFDMADIELP